MKLKTKPRFKGRNSKVKTEIAPTQATYHQPWRVAYFYPKLNNTTITQHCQLLYKSSYQSL